MNGTRYSLEVQPVIPEKLKGLKELSSDLMYSWDSKIRRLFFQLDAELWESCNHNPSIFLRRISQSRLEAQAGDPTFMEDYRQAMSAYNTYINATTNSEVSKHIDPEHDLIAYFCAEFGFHESLPIYSGGLGILAGDHCKAASDLRLPFVAIGLLYRQGYFTQTIDCNGNQIAHYHPTHFSDLPITQVLDEQGNKVRIKVDLPGREVTLRLWKARAGHITLYLLDSDLEVNSEADRSITYQLYGGDKVTRILQEIVLGIGGVRALSALGLKPTVWHINEGHAAFQILERCRNCITTGMDLESALEQVAAATVFTTHTPVSAGHDIFDHELMREYFTSFAEDLGVDMDTFLQFGASPSNQGGFNQTALALRGSRFHNGVSKVHGRVAARMEGYVWPQIPAAENPISSVTNGVHLPTFLATEWANMFTMRFGSEWRNQLLNPEFWERIHDVPDQSFWSIHQSLKSELLSLVQHVMLNQHERNGCSAAHITRMVKHVDPETTDVLTVGFARRFATYKRATLLFKDPGRLSNLVNNPMRPVVFLFAGKAHPSDLPGQQLIQTIQEYSRQREFEGKIILLEGYDMALARRLVSGVDVWLNTPEFPMEASGTSGEKAGINGVLNLSVLDGWWAEGYNGANGWAISPHEPHTDPEYRDSEESNELMSLLENEIAPLYYERDHRGYPAEWVAMSKESMISLIPRYNSARMVMDYVRDFYGPASKQGRALSQNGHGEAAALAQWKNRVIGAWANLGIRRIDEAPHAICSGEELPIRVAVDLAGLEETDIAVECLIGVETLAEEFETRVRYRLAPAGETDEGEKIYELDLAPPLSGLQHYKIRAYPMHKLMSHPFETGCMIWL